MGAETENVGWAILELMGHRKLAGYVSDDNGLVRIDVYLEDPEILMPGAVQVERTGAKPIATQWYGRQAVYCITASTVEMCLRVAEGNQPAPVGRWELPERAGVSADSVADDDKNDFDEGGY
ncbi:MAG TPA: hypothetical protein VG275_07180 [Solirubrobacteraceae bacterium]|jgi:hypothetical protein|nr:hypothetical protein [Solirubrobacteraceae bacterium]